MSFSFKKCSRCGDFALEKLATHSYCVNCNYFRVYDAEDLWQVPLWALKTIDKGEAEEKEDMK